MILCPEIAVTLLILPEQFELNINFFGIGSIKNELTIKTFDLPFQKCLLNNLHFFDSFPTIIEGADKTD